MTPTFTSALAVVAGSDLVTTISRSFASRFVDHYDLVLRVPPLAIIDFDLTLVWWQGRAGDRLLEWMRGAIRDAANAAE